MSQSAVLTTTQAIEGVINVLAPVIASAAPAAAPVIQAAETVANAVEANLPHHQAATDIATGLQALAGTAMVQSSPAAAAKLSGIALLFQDFLAPLTFSSIGDPTKCARRS